MNCPNCEHIIISGSICSNCGIDAYLYMKTLRISDTLYNRGLEQAKAGDLSSAIENLNKCIYFNKENIRARNLLGLVYFEYGRVGDALKQWVISVSTVKKNNAANSYIDELRNDARSREWYAASLKNYNQALVYLQQKSEDMAVIQLRRALEQNPRFVDALNLLAFCHLIQKEKEKAAEIVERTLNIDVNNHIALNYYKEIYPNKNKFDAIKKHSVYNQKGRYRSGPAPKPKKSLSNTFHIAEAVSFIAGCLCVFGLFYILIIPGVVNEKDAVILELNAKLLEKPADEIVYEEDGAERISELELEIDDLNQKITARDDQIDRQNRMIRIYTASNLQRRDNSEEAADILYMLDPSGLPVDVAELYDSLIADVFPKTVKNLYDLGVAHFNAQEYEDALACLEKAGLYVEYGGVPEDAVVYYLGFTSEMMEDAESAKKYYRDLIQEYPASNFFDAANERLNGLES